MAPTSAAGSSATTSSDAPSARCVSVSGAAARLAALRDLEGEPIAPARVETLRQTARTAVLSVTIHQGKNRQVRRMCAACGLMPAVWQGWLVVLGLWVTGNGLPFALVLGAIAAATAPAATVMVIKQYRAKGPVTETLLSVVALDDAVALIAFGLAVAVARTLESGGPVNLVEAILSPIWEVVLSVGVGLLLGILFTFLLRFFKDAGSRLSLSIAFVLGAVALANEVLGVSSLLMCMALGAAFCNLSKNSADVYRQVDAFTPPLFMMFFVLSGADLQLSVLPTIGVVGVVYVVLRVVGKWLGAWMGAKIMHASPAITKYLGPALLPQAGVAIGLSFLAQQVVPQYAATIRAVVLCATLIYELIGPAVSKKTLQAAGEIAKDA